MTAPTQDTMNQNEIKYHSPKEISKRWGVSERTVTRLLQTKQLAYIRIGRQMRIRERDIIDYERRNLHHPETA